MDSTLKIRTYSGYMGFVMVMLLTVISLMTKTVFSLLREQSVNR